MRHLLLVVTAALTAVLTAVLAGCTTESGTPDSDTPDSPSYSMIVPPSQPPSGRLTAELLQTTRDARTGQMQVWLDNGTEAEVVPVAIRYDDPRLSRTIEAERIRPVPATSRRGYPLALPEPVCGARPGRPPRLVVQTAAGRRRVPVTDPTHVVARTQEARCLERAVSRVVKLHWSDDVPVVDGIATLTLLAEPTGRRGSVTIEQVVGTPILTSADPGGWQPGVTVRGTDQPTEIPLRMRPARCDPHAFFDAGGATAFVVHLRLNDEPGHITLRMSPTGAEAAITFAVETCGFA